MGGERPTLLRRPVQKGFMGPLAILSVHQAMTEVAGVEAAQDLFQAASIRRLPSYDEPVREAKVAALHQTLRARYPGVAQDVLTRAGRITADCVMDRRMSLRAQTLLMSSPWPVAAWLLGRSTVQNAWTFSGSGTFEVVNRLTFRVKNNPLIKGESAEHTLCDYHASLFARFFQCAGSRSTDLHRSALRRKGR